MKFVNGQAACHMTRRVVYLYPKNGIKTAYEMMREYGFRHIPVCENKKLVGIISDRDILKHLTVDEDGSLEGPNLYLDEVSTKDIITCKFYDRISYIAGLMVEHQIDSIPIVDDNNVLEGIVTSTDLLQYLAYDNNESPLQRLPIKFQLQPFKSHSAGHAI